jgi:dTDP-4-amino-4,6-dideoxygalactose transaminase
MRKALEGFRVIPAAVDRDVRHIYQSFIAADDNCRDIRTLISSLRRKGIEATISNVVIHRQPYYRKKYALRDGDFPSSVWAYEHCLALPFHTKLTGADVRRIVDAVKEGI